MFKVKVTGDPGLVLEKRFKAMSAALGRAVLKAANIAGGYIAKEVKSTDKHGTGNLAGSFLPAAFVHSKDGIAAGALSNLEYAGMQDHGGKDGDGIIKPNPPNRNLAIPVTPAAEAVWPRDWSEGSLDFIPSKSKDGGILVDQRGEAQYILTPQVKITPRYFVRAAAKKVKETAPKQVMKDLAEEMRQAAPGGK